MTTKRRRRRRSLQEIESDARRRLYIRDLDDDAKVNRNQIIEPDGTVTNRREPDAR